MTETGLVFSTFESIATLLVVGVTGFYIIRRKIMPEETLGFLTPLAIDIALPALIFVNILSGFDPQTKPGWWELPLWWMAFQGFSAVMTLLFSKLSHQSVRREFAVSLFFQNGIFIPLAIVTGIFGKESPQIVTLILFTLFYPSFFFSTYPLFFLNKPQKRDFRKIVNPILVSTLVAVGITLGGAADHVPGFIVRSFSMIGNMAVPVLILVIGGNIYVDFKNRGRIVFLEMVKFVLVKNWVYPILMIGILSVLHVPDEIALMFFIQSAMPPITAIPVVVERVGGDGNIANQFLVSSSLFSLLSIPFVMYLFSRFVGGGVLF